MSDAIGIVLAAGKGTRMKIDLPKVLARACDRPLIDYVLDALSDAGVGHSIIVIGFGGPDVQAALKTRSNVQFATQSVQKGTGHAVMMCRDQISEFDGPVVVVAGDSPMLQSKSIQTLLEEYQNSGAACVMGTLVHDNPVGLGRIVRDDEGSFLRIVEEKDASDDEKSICEVNMSTYVFNCQAMLNSLDYLTDNNRQGEYYVTDVPGIMLANELTVKALPVLDPCEAFSVNTPEDLLQVETELKRRSDHG